MELNYSLDQLPEIAAKIIAHSENKIVLFVGEMGAGKTTLIKEIVKQLGSNDRVSSPTFSLVNEYNSESGIIYHFDFHRLNSEEEAYDMGFEEYVFSPAWKLIEWPQQIEHLLPKNKTTVKLENTAQNTRKMTLL